MDNQEIFDTVALHLVTQNHRCESDDTCKYHHLGRKCAVGCLISDEVYNSYYSPGMSYNPLEGKAIRSPVVKVAVEQSQETKLTMDNIALLEQLQQVHDQAPPPEWAEALAHVAEMFHLKNSLIEKEPTMNHNEFVNWLIDRAEDMRMEDRVFIYPLVRYMDGLRDKNTRLENIIKAVREEVERK